MIKNFKQYTDSQKRNYAFSRSNYNHDSYESFINSDEEICVIIGDKNSIWKDLMEVIDRYKKNVNEFRAYGNISLPGIDTKPVDEEFIKLLEDGEYLDSKVVIFIDNGKHLHWDEYIKPLFAYGDTYIKTNTYRYYVNDKKTVNPDAEENGDSDMDDKEEKKSEYLKHLHGDGLYDEVGDGIHFYNIKDGDSIEKIHNDIIGITNKYATFDGFKRHEHIAWEWAKKHGIDKEVQDCF